MKWILLYLILNWVYIFMERRSDVADMFREGNYIRLIFFLLFGLPIDMVFISMFIILSFSRYFRKDNGENDS